MSALRHAGFLSIAEPLTPQSRATSRLVLGSGLGRFSAANYSVFEQRRKLLAFSVAFSVLAFSGFDSTMNFEAYVEYNRRQLDGGPTR